MDADVSSEWTDKHGRRNILVDQRLDFGPVEDPRHDYEEHVRRFAGTAPEIRDLCWCGQPEEHWLHAKETIG